MNGDLPGMITEPEAIALLREYRIPYPDYAIARDAQQAVEIAEGLGYPVVLKIVSSDVIHKSEAGGVAIGLEDGTAVRQAFGQILASVQGRHPGTSLQQMLVCRQAPAGLEAIVGALHDAMFGPALMFGLGGIFTEVLRDVTFRILPIRRHDAEEMIREIRGYPLLAGTRGQAGCDLHALADLLLSVSRMVSERPEIEELDLNPVRLYKEGLMALDVRIMTREPRG